MKSTYKELIDLQKKECCKYWIRAWVEGICDRVAGPKRSEGGGCFIYCPDCGVKFEIPT